MDRDINKHIKAYHQFQLRKTDHQPPPALLTLLPQPTKPNVQVHADLHGPLKHLVTTKSTSWLLRTLLLNTSSLWPLKTKKPKQLQKQSSRNGSVDMEYPWKLSQMKENNSATNWLTASTSIFKLSTAQPQVITLSAMHKLKCVTKPLQSISTHL